MMKKHIFAIIIILALPFSVQAQSYKILAVVNGESVSTQQVKERVKLIMQSAGMKDTADNKRKVTEEVADILVNEVLQKQEAREKNIELKDPEIDAVLADLEKRNGLEAGGIKNFVAKNNISFASMRDQIVATILWQKILATFVRPTIEVTEEDIEKAKKDIANKPKVKVEKFVSLSEIIVPIEFGKEQEAKDMADTIVRTARTGTEKFEELASRYSVGKTAGKKGFVGWLQEDGMIEPLAGAVRKTKAGAVADAIKADSMYVILKVNERKTNEPPKENITPENKALMNKMEAGAKKYIKSMREKAFIEKKYKDENLYEFVWG